MRPLLWKIAMFLKPRPRWYHLTPDRFLVGLLLVVGVLFLSERFVWFPFNEKKGWAVLIAVASVCGAVVLLLLWMIVALIFRWRFQFSIRSLLVFVLVCAVMSSWFSVRMKQARRQRDVVAVIVEGDGCVLHDYEMVSPWQPEPSAPTWLINLLGVDFFEGVAYADCRSSNFDGKTAYLSKLTNLEVYFSGAQVTDSGLVHLEGLTKLRWVDLSFAQVTDSGLVHLEGLTKLRWVDLSRTQVTPEGVKKLQQALPNCEIAH